MKPLIVSVHGPPGVGKSLTHLLAAKALYNTNPMAADKCPGHHCAGYKVRYGVWDAHAQVGRECLMQITARGILLWLAEFAGEGLVCCCTYCIGSDA